MTTRRVIVVLGRVVHFVVVAKLADLGKEEGRRNLLLTD